MRFPRIRLSLGVKFLLPLFALALLVGCKQQTVTAPSGDTSSAATSEPSSPSDAMPSSTASTSNTPIGFDGQLLSGKHTVILKTSKGDITVELDADAAPKTVTNFVVLAKAGYYNGLTFHRVIPDFMIQGGDPNGNGTGGTSIYGETFEDEPNALPMVRGAIAMANRGPNTNGSQFFIIQAPETPWLQGRHTIFGKVTKGMDVVDAIVAVPRDSQDRPNTAVTYTVEVKN